MLTMFFNGKKKKKKRGGPKGPDEVVNALACPKRSSRGATATSA